jgi:hypothetical protein
VRTSMRHLVRSSPGIVANALAIAAIGLAPLVTAHAANRATAAHFGRAVSLRLPAGAQSGSGIAGGASCAAAGSCTVAGSYTDASSVSQPMVIIRSSGGWARGRKLGLPSNADPALGGGASAVSCSRPKSCTVVGNYRTSAGFASFAETESRGSWRPTTHVTLPANAAAAGDSSVGGVACTGPGSCVLAGDYTDNHGQVRAMVATQSSGTWSAAREVRAPSNASTAGGVFLTAIACPAAGACVAVGQYNDTAGHARALAVSQSRGTWRQAVQLILPGDAAAVPLAAVNSVGCSATGACIAVGRYVTKAHSFAPMSVVSKNGTWSHAVHIRSVPSNAGTTPGVFVNSVACPVGAPCRAVGNYRLKSGGEGALVLTRSGSSWSAGQIQAPKDTALGDRASASANAIGCSRSGYCVAEGSYKTSGNVMRLMAATG